MMTLQDLIAKIETVAFETQFSVINSFKIFIKALDGNETVKQLVQFIHADSHSAEGVLDRIQLLANDKPESGVMHTHDIKVVVYLHALHAANYSKLTLAAIETIQNTPGFYWSRKYTEYIQASIETVEKRA